MIYIRVNIILFIFLPGMNVVETENLILKFIWKCKRSRKSKAIWRTKLENLHYLISRLNVSPGMVAKPQHFERKSPVDHLSSGVPN